MRIQRRATVAAPTPPLSVQQASAPASIARAGRVALDIPKDLHQHYFGRGRRRYRLPRFSDLRDITQSKTLGIDQAELKALVKTTLIRLNKDNRLKSKDSLDAIVDAIFPAPGSIDQSAFEAAVDSSDRTLIYRSVLDTNARIKDKDRPKLRSVMRWAIKIIRQAQTSKTMLTRVFGSKQADAAGNYKKAGDRLQLFVDSSAALNKSVNTDYNRDDAALYLGGWADFDDQVIHLEPGVAKVTHSKESVATLVHEAAHLADGAIEVQFALVKYRKDLLASKDAKFKKDLPQLKKISKALHLSLHRQNPGHETVTQLDIVLAESIARVVSDMGDHSASIKLALTPKDTSEIQKASDRLINDAIRSYGALLGDSKKDRTLTDWLVAHYGKAFY
ncbi:hypothetical protein A8C75_20005 [Marinobacterium aestuarii]|uniref:Uncharacterized protein n=1 Tax=Marinobacterium aestuarii TaxID=1821621 RepID=A0A1A9F2W0_9GAMM|nr:hypothetical protein [Marinobacterium aestuarii]ANG64527.1 hypothetical protein A8C75_20005 [Marinobacterium aestuarii]